MPVRGEDLPPGLRARLEAELRAGTLVPSRPSKHAQRRSAPGSARVRCICGEVFEWTTSGDATPAAVSRHAETSGHCRFATEFTGPDDPPDRRKAHS